MAKIFQKFEIGISINSLKLLVYCCFEGAEVVTITLIIESHSINRITFYNFYRITFYKFPK